MRAQNVSPFPFPLPPPQTSTKGGDELGSRNGGGVSSVQLLEKIFSASVGASLTSFVVTPLDVVKIRMQAQRNSHGGLPKIDFRTSYVFCSRFYDHVEPCGCRTLYVFDQPATRMPITGTLDGVIKITRYEGISGLWRGLSPTLLMSIPATVVYFVGYEGIKEALKKSNVMKELDPKISTFIIPLLAGSSARIVAVTLISPLELLKTKMQHRGKDGGFIATASEILMAARNNGLKVMYKGLVPTLWRDVPFSAIYWAAYERFRAMYQRMKCSRETLSVSDNFFTSFFAGASSGMIAAALTTPFDVAKTRQQVDLLAQNIRPKTILQHLAEIWKMEGLAGLCRGIIPRVCKVAPSCAIMVGSYEFGKSYLSSYRQQL